MFQKIVTGALIAGFGAGLLAAALQIAFMQPVFLHAEAFESGALAHFGANASAAAFPRSFDLTRDALTVVFTALIYCGYGMLLLAAMGLTVEAGYTISAHGGLVWGIGGFVAAQLAPAFGLPPELPGMAAGDLFARQIWWFATVGGTAAALWLIAYGRSPVAWGTAVILLAAPHIIGAPLPETLTGPAPPELGAMFTARSLGIGLAAWALLGLLSARILAED